MARSDPLEIILEDMDRFIARETVGVLFEISATLIEDTPLRDGWARSQWVAKIRSPYRANLTKVKPTSGQISARSNESQNELFKIAASYNLDAGPLFLSNNVPYIGRLNDGHSPQAPPGYIQLGVLKAVNAKRAGR